MDADRVGSVNNRRQPQVFAHLLDGNLVTWRSKKQTVVTRSRAEVEFRDVAHEMCKLLWLKKFLEEKKIQTGAPIRLYYDNKAAIKT